ncbi:MAG: hypothetical protein GY946_24705 [bacterium]|nr:hypothetical protein [bacterium]
MTKASISPATLPWRKRRPILSRVVLFGLGGALATGLLLMLTQREEEDRGVKLAGELDGFAVLLTMEGGTDEILKKVGEKYGSDQVPAALRASALRWRAMALKRKAGYEAESGVKPDDVEAAYVEAQAAKPQGETKRALLLEWAEFRLERDDGKGALELIAQGEYSTSPIWAMLAERFASVAVAIDDPTAGAKRLDAALAGAKGRMPMTIVVKSGGVEWTFSAALTNATEKLDLLLAEIGQDARPAWRRLRPLVAKDQLSGLICADALCRHGAMDDARLAFRAAHMLHPDQAKARVEADYPDLQGLLDELAD